MQEVKLDQISKLDYRTKEAYKTLRTNIEFCGEENKVISITSCTPNERKSSVSMNLAYAMAEAKKNVILIDCDLRKSVLAGRYRTGIVKFGVTHCLIGKVKIRDAICSTNVNNLYMMFSGPVPPNPSELLSSKNFEILLETLKQTFDYILIDTPPLGSVIDSAIVAKECDGTILVLENKAISYKFAQRVKEQLDKTGCRILGAVLNKVDMNSKGYYGHYSKYYGKYYGNYGKSEEKV